MNKRNNRNSLFLIPDSASGRAAGFTLVEVIIGITLMLGIGYGIYLVTSNILEVVARNEWRSQAVSVIENEIELARNLNYMDVGVEGGSPAGKLKAEKTISFGGLEFKLLTTVRNIDDPFDGTQGGDPNDTAPADYKLVEFEVECLSCPTSFSPIIMTTTVAPKSLETTTNNGSLFINVFNASGLPISGADLQVINSTTNPTITINDQTNANGVLQLVDIPTSTQSYDITVSKTGYSSDQTYELGAPANPNPVKAHATVVSQGVTSVSFAIDKVSTINFNASDKMCSGIQGVDFLLQGTKLIGTAPDVFKYSASLITNTNGFVAINNVEWDAYTLTNLDTNYSLAGSSPLSPITINPDSTADIRWLLRQANPSGIRVAVKDNTGQLIDDASVRLQGAGFDKTLITGRNFFGETDWSGGNYTSKATGTEVDSLPGQIGLVSTAGKYVTSTVSTLISSTFDLGTSITNLYEVSWNPASQPAQTGSNSLRLQMASNDDASTWNYIGPDGTSSSYYTVSSSTIHASHDNDRYLRYRVLLQTADADFTPTLEDINFNFSSSCIPDGQVFFDGLTNGTFTLMVVMPGFQTFTDSAVSVSSDWQTYEVTLTP